jgi:hypothetical protein
MDPDLAQVLDEGTRHELILIAALHAEARRLPVRSPGPQESPDPSRPPGVPRDTADG